MHAYTHVHVNTGFVLHPCSFVTSRAHYQRLRDTYRIWVIKIIFLRICVFIYRHIFFLVFPVIPLAHSGPHAEASPLTPPFRSEFLLRNGCVGHLTQGRVQTHCTRPRRWRRQRAVCRGAGCGNAIWSRSPAPESPAPCP